MNASSAILETTGIIESRERKTDQAPPSRRVPYSDPWAAEEAVASEAVASEVVSEVAQPEAAVPAAVGKN